MSKSLSDTAVWREKFEQNIFHLGDSDPQLKEIFSTVSDISTVKEFIHDQFIESAEAYAKRYSAVDYFQSLLIESFKRIGWNSELAEKMNILDIGSGAGNSILPLLSLCPNSEIIASDLSIPLLKILKNDLIEETR
jgi:methylase of polypeptide subunit release factors